MLRTVSLMKFATRLNSFIAGGDTAAALRRISATKGIDYVDLNYPEHFVGIEPEFVDAGGVALGADSVIAEVEQQIVAFAA